DDVVERDIARDLIAQPVLVNVSSFLLDCLAAATQHIRPLQGPEVGVFRLFQQTLDQSRPLVPVGAREEGAGLLRRSENAADIKIGPAYELLVTAQLRWQDAEHL